ncbi:putative ribonuclease H-like domain-containing protein, partial [Tanacetum coccineum]
ELKRLKRQEKKANDAAEALRKEFAQDTEDLLLQAGAARATSTNTVNIVSTQLSIVNPSNVFSTGGPSNHNLTNYADQDDSQIPTLEDIYGNSNDGIFTNASYNDEGAVTDFTNLETIVNVSPIPTSSIHSIHPTTQILGDPKSAVQTRSKVNKSSGAHAFVSYIEKQRRNNHKDFQHCFFACFLSQIEPKKISEALEDESWVDAMQEELLQFKIQKVRMLVDLPYGKKEIGTKWVYKNKKDERGVMVRNKARLVAQRYRQEERIDYGCDPKFPKKVYKVMKALYGLHQAPRAWYATLSTFLLRSGYRRGTIDKTLFIKKDKNDIIFQMSSMGELTFFLGLQVKQKEDGIFISQDKYVAEILKKFDFMSVKTACTPIETHKPLVKDEEAAYVDVHLYRPMIGSLMYLTTSRPDIMFAACACSRFQVTPKTSHLHAVKRIFSDYGGANLDRKSTTGGCQFLGHRLILWQCKKQTIMAISTTEDEYVAAANCYGQLLIGVQRWYSLELLQFVVEILVRRWVVDDMMTFEVSMMLILREENAMKHGCSLSVGFYHHTTNGHQFTMSNRHQELASPEQMTSGKDLSNPLIVDSLLKTIWLSMQMYCNEALAIPRQWANWTVNGKVCFTSQVEKKYPLPQDTLTRMLRWKLHVNYEIPEMAYELLKFIRKITSLGEDCWELKGFYKFILLEGLSAAIED